MRKEIFKFLVLLTVALGAGPVSAQMWRWSTTAANNATADPSINYQEGMSPSSVNDSARAAMAATARWRDDISGLLVTSGTSSAYTVTTSEGLQTPTPVDGQMISVTVNATNAAGATLAADGGTAYPIQSAAGSVVASGVLISGSPYTLKYSSANSAWMLRNYYGNPFSIPLGAMIDYTGDTSPSSNFVFPAGQCISRTTYASYFAIVGIRFGACDGSTTFAVPDLRGRIGVPLDNLNGTAANRITGAASGCGVSWTNIGNFCGQQSYTLGVGQIPPATLSGTVDISHDHYTPGDSTSLNVSTGGAVIVARLGVGNPLNTGNTQGFVSGSTNRAVSMTPLPYTGGPHPTVMPIFAITKLLRVL